MARVLIFLLVLFAAAPAAAEAFRSDRIIVETRGRGPDVILIPGLASTPAVWRDTASRLDGRYRLHLVTIRGFGETPPGANASGRLGEPVAAELARYIRHQNLRRTAVIGHSMGGQIALRLAADAPASVDRLMIVDSLPFLGVLIDPQASRADMQPLARIAYGAVMLLGDAAWAGDNSAVERALGGMPNTPLGLLGWGDGDRRVLAQGLYECLTRDLRPHLGRVRAPVTVVYGWHAGMTLTPEQVDATFRRQFRGLPTPARFQRIDGADHMVMHAQPRRFAEAVERFLG